MKLKPIGRKLVATLYEPPKKGNLILNDAPRDRFIIQSVVKNDLGLKEGDLVLVEKLRAHEKEVEGEKIYLINLDHVLGVFE